MADDSWRKKAQKALNETGQAYIAVFIDPKTSRAVTMATLAEGQVPEVLVGIAADLRSGTLKLNAVERERGQG